LLAVNGFSWTATPVAYVAELIGEAHKSIKVPADVQQAHTILNELYNSGEDRTISAHYAEFKAVLGGRRGRMLCVHMAEINLAMNTRHRNDERLEAALSEIDELLAITKPPVIDLRYTRANCLSAMRRDQEAVLEYRRTLEEKTHSNYHSIGAQCWKNMGASLERLGSDSEAMTAYEEALKLDPDLAEARLALAHCCARAKDFAKAAELVDGIARRKSSALDRNTIQGWKAHYLSLTDAPEKALDVLLDLVGSGHEAKWIWPWSANLVVRIGRSSPAALAKALTYWRRYLHEHPGNKLAERHRLLSLWSLRQHLSGEATGKKPEAVKDGAVGVGFDQFREAALRLIEDKDNEAFWWDRIGHWAQADGDWEEAEGAYRRAYALQPRDYEYCLGTALNQLDRYEEAVPLLTSAASFHDDSMAWHQLGVAYAGRGDWAAAAAAYERAIERDPNEPNPWFNLGGAHWNARNYAAAKQTWQQALQRFPNDASAAKAREFLRELNQKSK
jgi:tetratricopeptide (TPR) repeat protein